MPAARDPRVDACVAVMPSRLAPIARAARAAVRKAAPGLEEAICTGIPHFRGSGWVCYLADHRAHVNLGFHQGAHLRDPRGLLDGTGTGTGLRHVKLRSPADARRPAVAALVREAAALDARLARGRA